MAKFPTFPTLYDECKTVTITKLKEWGYLEPNQIITGGMITWSRNGNKTGSIGISASTISPTSYIELNYNYKETTPIHYRINLVSVPSNIGKGVLWYFVCPKTGKQCRKLYLIEGYFYHRSASPGMYEKQTYSHKNRILFRKFDALFGTDKVFEQLNSKGFKKTYAGKPTKRYLKLMRKIREAEGVNENEILAGLIR